MKWLTTKQAAKYLDRDVSSVNMYIIEGKLHPRKDKSHSNKRKVGRKTFLFDSRELKEFKKTLGTRRNWTTNVKKEKTYSRKKTRNISPKGW